MEMKKVEIADLRGSALNWAVAQAVGVAVWIAEKNEPEHTIRIEGGCSKSYNPSTDWSQGGPLIERFKVAVTYHNGRVRWPCCTTAERHPRSYCGDTILETAMQSIVDLHAADGMVSIPAVL